MATAAYKAWVADGRPIIPATPIRQKVERMRLAIPRAAGIFSWYANEAHYADDFPQDHTPYSETAWPVSPCPYPYVFATDWMHRPDLGVDCFKLFDYWIAEARAGRTPWVKYYIWQAKLYHVRNNWQPRANSGHGDHIHESHRTDHRDTMLGGWSVLPPGGGDMTPDESREAYYNAWRTRGIQLMQDPIVIPANAARGVPVAVTEPNMVARAILAAGGALSPADLEQVKAMAYQGAEAGAEAGSLTQAEVVEAVNIAEDS